MMVYFVVERLLSPHGFLLLDIVSGIVLLTIIIIFLLFTFLIVKHLSY